MKEISQLYRLCGLIIHRPVIHDKIVQITKMNHLPTKTFLQVTIISPYHHLNVILRISLVHLLTINQTIFASDENLP